MRKYFDRIFFDKPKIYQKRIIGLLLIIIGIILIYYPTNLNLKISLSTIFIGFILIFIIDEKRISRTITGNYLIVIIILWIFILFIITKDIQYDNFLIIGILGILIIRELLDAFMSPILKKRMILLSYLLFIFFIIIIGQRIINIVGI